MVIGPTPPGTGVIAAATSRGFVVGDVADQPRLAVLGCGTRLMPTSITTAPGLIQSPLTISGPADGGDDDVGAADHVGQVAGARMGDGHRRAFAEQQHRHRLADDVGAADHHRLLAGKVAKLGLEQVQAAERRAGHQRVEPGRRAGRR